MPRGSLRGSTPPQSPWAGSALRSGTTEVDFGGQKWYAIGFNGSGVNPIASSLTLLSEGSMGNSAFRADGTNDYSGSDIQTFINNLGGSFDLRERAAMAGLTLDYVAGSQPTNQKLWLLSTAQASAVSSDVLQLAAGAWWTRTPSEYYNPATVSDGVVNSYGPPCTQACCVRPGMAISLSSVAFAMPNDGTKSAAVGTLASVTVGGELKLTLLDTNPSDLNLTLSSPPASATVNQGDTFSLGYSGAVTGSNKFVSCAFVGASDGIVKYYEKISTAANGTLYIPIQSTILPGSYTLLLFNEQINSGNASDYASTPTAIALTVTGTVNQAPVLKPGVESTATASAAVGTNYSLDLSTIFSDPDGNALSYRVSVNGASAIPADDSYVYTPASAGTYTLKFNAYDGAALSPSYTVTLTGYTVPVTAVHVHLQNNATAISRSTSQLQLYAEVSPSNATNQTLAWSASVSGGGSFADADIDAANVMRLSSFTSDGTITITVSSQDGSGISGTLILSVLQYISTGVSVTSSGSTLNVGGSMQMDFSVQPSAAQQAVHWSISSGGSYGSLNGDVLNATAPGVITVRATALDGSTAYGEKTITVKSTQTAPSAPTLASKNASSATLNTITGAEYSRDGTNWQDSTTFTGLSPYTAYNLFARLKETATAWASASSAALSVTTDKAVLGGSVAVSGNLAYGQTLTADTSALSSTPSAALGALSCQWTRNGSNISGANTSSYVVRTADIGAVLNVIVSAANCLGSVGSANTVAATKATPSFSTPTGLAATYGQTLAAVSLPSGFVWEQPLTTSVGNAGSRSFTVTYTPSDTTDYTVVTGISVSITVGKATPSFTAPTGLTATYGQTLADVSLPSGFAWESLLATPVGNAGGSNFTVAFTPDDTSNYSIVTGIHVTIAVTKANPGYSAPIGLSATFGQTLEDVALPSGFTWEQPRSTSVGVVGDHGFTVTYTPSDTANYNTVTAIAVTVSVEKADPSYTAPTGLSATYGQTLADIALPSGFSWEQPPETSVGGAGNRAFTVTFMPEDTENYNVITGISVTVAVAKADPGYTTPTGLTAIYGQTLAAVSLPSGFTWESPLTTSVGGAGIHGFTVVFTPADKDNYNAVSGIPVTVDVGKATPDYARPLGLTATYGQTLETVPLPEGFAWEAPLSTPVGGAGERAFTVTYTPPDTDNYLTLTGIPVSIVVGKATPDYTRPMGLTATYGQTLADVALPEGFSWESPADTSVGGAGEHAFSVTFTPADADDYKTLTGIPVSVTVNKADPSYSVPSGLTATFGQTLADVALPSGFAWDLPLTTSVGGAGDRSFTVTFTPADTDNYNTVTGVSVTVAVAKATPGYTAPSGLTATYGQTLSDVELPLGFTWEDDPTTPVGGTGERSFTVTFTPADTDNFATVSDIPVVISVGKAAPDYTVPSGLVATVGQALSDVPLPAGFTWQDPLTTSVGDPGIKVFDVMFTPADSDNYETVTGIPVSLQVYLPSSEKSTDLAGILLSAGTLSPAFDASVTQYTVTLLETDTSVTVTPVKAYEDAAVTIDGSGVSSKAVKLDNGQSCTMKIGVTCRGIHGKYYTLTIVRQKSTACALTSLSVSNCTDALNYTGALAYNLTAQENKTFVKVLAGRGDPHEKIYINGFLTSKMSIAVASGGKSVITIIVRSQDNMHQSVYTVTVARPPHISSFTGRPKLSGVPTAQAGKPLTFAYTLAGGGETKIEINLSGTWVTLLDRADKSGSKSYAWDGTVGAAMLPAGAYQVRISCTANGAQSQYVYLAVAVK